jgi:hypothetical protein
MKKTMLALLLLGSISGRAANTFITGAGGGSTSSACSMSVSGVSAGNFLFIAATCYAGDCSSMNTPTDSHNTYTVSRSLTDNGHGQRFQTWTATAVATSSLTISVSTTPSNGEIACTIGVFGGSTLINLGAYASVTGAAGTSWDSGSATVTAGALRIGIVGALNSFNGAWAFTAGSGWTSASSYGFVPCSANFCPGIGLMYDLSAAGGSQDALATVSGVNNGFIIEDWLSPPASPSAAGHAILF